MSSTTPLEFMQNAQMFQTMFVKPMLDAQETANKRHQDEIKTIIEPVVEGHRILRTEVDALKRDQKKALAGWGVYATLVGIACTAAWKWVASKIHFT